MLQEPWSLLYVQPTVVNTRISLPKPQVIRTGNSEIYASIAAAMTPCNVVPGRTSHRSIRLSQVSLNSNSDGWLKGTFQYMQTRWQFRGFVIALLTSCSRRESCGFSDLLQPSTWVGFLVAIFGLSVRKSPTELRSMLNNNNQPNHLRRMHCISMLAVAGLGSGSQVEILLPYLHMRSCVTVTSHAALTAQVEIDPIAVFAYAIVCRLDVACCCNVRLK
jgi:hypothetical protein